MLFQYFNKQIFRLFFNFAAKNNTWLIWMHDHLETNMVAIVNNAYLKVYFQLVFQWMTACAYGKGYPRMRIVPKFKIGAVS